jgi:hypothetical protein
MRTLLDECFFVTQYDLGPFKSVNVSVSIWLYNLKKGVNGLKNPELCGLGPSSPITFNGLHNTCWAHSPRRMADYTKLASKPSRIPKSPLHVFGHFRPKLTTQPLKQGIPVGSPSFSL